jgi:hypothetical protein
MQPSSSGLIGVASVARICRRRSSGSCSQSSRTDAKSTSPPDSNRRAKPEGTRGRSVTRQVRPSASANSRSSFTGTFLPFVAAPRRRARACCRLRREDTADGSAGVAPLRLTLPYHRSVHLPPVPHQRREPSALCAHAGTPRPIPNRHASAARDCGPSRNRLGDRLSVASSCCRKSRGS